MYDARQVTSWFIERAAKDGRVLSVAQMMKLLFIAHGWHLALRDKPLFGNRIEAWGVGPVIMDVYKTFRPQGRRPGKPDPRFPAVADQSDVDFLEQIYDRYSGISFQHLSNLTHTAGGPWETALKWGKRCAEIPDELIAAHYLVKQQRHEARNEQRNSIG